MLLAAKRPGDALKEFETSQLREPDRFRSLFGAAQAAAQSGDRSKAKRYYARLVEIAARQSAMDGASSFANPAVSPLCNNRATASPTSAKFCSTVSGSAAAAAHKADVSRAVVAHASCFTSLRCAFGAALVFIVSDAA